MESGRSQRFYRSTLASRYEHELPATMTCDICRQSFQFPYRSANHLRQSFSNEGTSFHFLIPPFLHELEFPGNRSNEDAQRPRQYSVLSAYFLFLELIISAGLWGVGERSPTPVPSVFHLPLLLWPPAAPTFSTPTRNSLFFRPNGSTRGLSMVRLHSLLVQQVSSIACVVVLAWR